MTQDRELLLGIGKRIALCRKKMHWSQSDLAEQAHLSVQALSYIENGQRGMRPQSLIRLSESLGVSTDYILKGTVLETDVSETVARLTGLSADYQEVVFNLIEDFEKLQKKNGN